MMEQSNEPRITTVRPSRHDDAEGAGRMDDSTERFQAADATTPGTGAAPDTWSPRGDNFSSSASPIGDGSNTPVGNEPTSFESWDARHKDSARDQYESSGPFDWAGRAFGLLSGAPGGGLAALTIGGLLYAWWRRRQARQSRIAQLQRSLVTAGLAAGSWATRAGVPKAVGRAAGQTRSPWLPFALLPIALWLRSQGRQGQRAGDQMLEPLKLEDRGKRLARQTAKVVEKEGRRLIRENDPIEDRGSSRWPWLLTLPVLGGAAYVGRRLMSSNGSANGSTSEPSRMVRDVMTRDPEVVSPDAKIAEVARKMRDLDVGALPVCDGERLLGMVTDRDISVRVTAEGKDPNETPVRQAMSAELTWVFEDETARSAATIMSQRQIRRLPVMDRDDKLVGIVALGDVARELGDDMLSGETLEQISKPNR